MYDLFFLPFFASKSEDEVARAVVERLPDDYADQLRKTGEPWYEDFDLKRFLIARNYDVDKTVSMILNHIAWRQ